MKQKEMNGIYIWRIVFTVMIMIFHFDTFFFVRANLNLQGAFGWYIAVEFFFIVSGFLLSKKAEATPEDYQTSKYTLGRVKKIYPAYLLAFLFTLGTIVYYTDWMQSPVKIYEQLADNFLEAVMLQGIGLARESYINLTTWYISVMLIAGHFIFFALKKNRKLYLEIIGPIVVIVSFSYLYRKYGCLDVTTANSEGIFENGSLLRGFADMTMGVYSYEIYKRIKGKITNYVPLKIFGTLLILFTIFASLRYGKICADFMYVFILMIAVAIAFLPWESTMYTKGRAMLEYCSKLTLNVYLLHHAFREWIFPHLYADGPYLKFGLKLEIMILYIAVTVLAAVLMNLLIKGVKKLFTAVYKSHR